MRFLLPTAGAILGILIARGQQATTLETLGYLFVGLAVGYGINWLTSRSTRGGS